MTQQRVASHDDAVSTPQSSQSTVVGLLAEYPDKRTILSAAESVRDLGFTKTDAYSPFPVEGLADALGHPRSPMPAIVLAGGLAGGSGIYLLIYWINLYAYPLNIGGRPLHSWPSFIPPTFECTVLLGSIMGILGLLFVCRLPRLHHVVFSVDRFKRASTDSFFIYVNQSDPLFDEHSTYQLLERLGASKVWRLHDDD